MTTFDWQTLLTEWSAALLADNEIVAALPPARAEQIAAPGMPVDRARAPMMV